MPAPSDTDIAQIAASYNVPPAILMGLVRQMGSRPTYGMPAATLGAYNLSSATLQNDSLLALSVAARTLAQSFAQSGSWESALSLYLTGDANAWESPTSATGGQVFGILGQAAVSPSFGMTGFAPSDPSMFMRGAGAFATHLQSLVGMGGVVSPQSVHQYRQSYASYGLQATHAFTPSANMEQVAEDILSAAKLPVTDANIAVLSTMARGEGMDPSSFNWLATTSDAGNVVGTVPNTPGVKRYATYQDGINASAQTLRNGNYDAMIAHMQAGSDLQTMARDPNVQRNLRTWQGGSSEDVNLLLGTSNVSGTPSQVQSAAQHPDPGKVGEFAAQLQSNGIDPQDFAEHFGTLADHRRQLLHAQRTDISDYAAMHQALVMAKEPQPVSRTGILSYLRSQPHPSYPTVTVGDFADTFNRASLYSVLHTQQIPTEAEAARLVGLDHKAINDYYVNKSGGAAKPKTDDAAQRQQDRGL